MRDLSLHLLDLAENSVRANASLVELTLTIDESKLITLTIRDNGCGMDAELLARVSSPFGTTRTTRKVGLGIPLMMQNAQLTGGELHIESEVGVGTLLTVTLHGDSIDCLPLGDIAGTVTTLASANPDHPEFCFTCITPGGRSDFDTREIKAALDGVSLNEPEVVAWMHDSLSEELNEILKGWL